MAKYIRDPAEVHKAWRELKVFIDLGFEPFPLRRFDATTEEGNPAGKMPRDKGWQFIDYSRFDFKSHMSKGYNVGIRLLPNQLVLDVDPRNGGEESIRALYWDVPGLATVLQRCPVVLSGRGDGGRHYYMHKPPDVRTRVNFSALPGIDFKRGPGLVVAVGSLHQATSKPYTLQFIPTSVPDAPPELITMLKHPVQPVRGNGADISLPELEKMLACIPASDFGQGGPYHDEWLTMMFACHAATHGDGEDVWLDWCATDDQYGEDARERNRLRWLSADSAIPNGTTFRTLLRHLSRVGRKDLVRRVGEWDDEPDEPVGESKATGLWG